MAESAALLVDDVFPKRPVRQWMLSVPFPLRFLFASHPGIMGKVLRIVCRAISTYQCRKAGFKTRDAQTGAVTLLQRFGSALNLKFTFICCFLTAFISSQSKGSCAFDRSRRPRRKNSRRSSTVSLIE